MRRWGLGVTVMALATIAGCSSFSGSSSETPPEPSPDAGGAGDASSLVDGGTTSTGIVVRGVVTNDAPSADGTAQLPPGTQPGDLLWATVFGVPAGDVNTCDPAAGWVRKRATQTRACSTVYSVSEHFFRIATENEPSPATPCRPSPSAADKPSFQTVLAAFGGVDPAIPFDDYQVGEVPLAERPVTLSAPATTASASGALPFVVFVDPDGQGSNKWTSPPDMQRRAATNNIAFFVGRAVGPGALPERDTQKENSNQDGQFCWTAEGLSVVLHPKP